MTALSPVWLDSRSRYLRDMYRPGMVMEQTTQFRAVMSAVNMLPESERPRVVGLGPTHRAVGESVFSVHAE
ncbi:conjugal transfer nickase/helicase TraI [Escherichia coli]|nr:hypothetical protein [Escherichia coli]SQK05995.1 conjugal transfer nickase/helicase TraI [Escherichia coli]